MYFEHHELISSQVDFDMDRSKLYNNYIYTLRVRVGCDGEFILRSEDATYKKMVVCIRKKNFIRYFRTCLYLSNSPRQEEYCPLMILLVVSIDQTSMRCVSIFVDNNKKHSTVNPASFLHTDGDGLYLSSV
jgi:hypothetical protein